jgi:autotransporter translocation and assembly factor TamB
MDDATIASYLLTGRPPDQATVAGEQAAEIAIGGVSRLVEAFANENFGLDVVEIEPSGIDGAQFTVGKYISPKTYIYVKQPLALGDNTGSTNGNRGTQLGLEYELYSWLISEVSSRNGAFRLNLRWQISY